MQDTLHIQKRAGGALRLFILMVLHIIDALIAIVLLTRLAPSSGRAARVA